MNPLVIVLVIVGILAVVMLVLALRSGRGTESEISERLDSFVGDQVPQMTDQDIEKEAKRLSKLTEGINKVIERRTFGNRISTQLAQASLKITVTEYLILTAASVVVLTALAFLLFGRLTYRVEANFIIRTDDLANRKASSRPLRVRYSEKTGMKDTVREPSANRRRKRLGIRKATKKASAARPAPKKPAMTTSLTNPSMRLSKVAAPTIPAALVTFEFSVIVWLRPGCIPAPAGPPGLITEAIDKILLTSYFNCFNYYCLNKTIFERSSNIGEP